MFRIYNGGNISIGGGTLSTLFNITQPIIGLGTINATASTSIFNGTNTQFTNTFKVGDSIYVNGYTYSISSITSDTLMATTASIVATMSSSSYSLNGGSLFSVYGNGIVTIGTTPALSGSYSSVINGIKFQTGTDAFINGIRIGTGGLYGTRNLLIGGGGFGQLAGNLITSGLNNTIIGNFAGCGITTGGSNIIIGDQAGYTGNQSSNINIGGGNLVGGNNISIGGNLTSAYNSTLIGIGSSHTGALSAILGQGSSINSGYSVVLGAAITTLGSGLNNQIIIGAYAVGLTANTTVIGVSPTVNTALGQFPTRSTVLYGNLNVSSYLSTNYALLGVNQDNYGLGTITAAIGTSSVVGTTTQFTNTFKVGDSIFVGGYTYSISTITSDTLLTITGTVSATMSSSTYSLIGGNRFNVYGNGNVSIGTTLNTSKLSIGGNILNALTNGQSAISGGSMLNIASASYQDNVAGQNTLHNKIASSYIGTSTFNALNGNANYDIAANLYIDSDPIKGTNVGTQYSAYGIYVAGTSYANIVTGNSGNISNLTVGGNLTVGQILGINSPTIDTNIAAWSTAGIRFYTNSLKLARFSPTGNFTIGSYNDNSSLFSVEQQGLGQGTMTVTLASGTTYNITGTGTKFTQISPSNYFLLSINQSIYQFAVVSSDTAATATLLSGSTASVGTQSSFIMSANKGTMTLSGTTITGAGTQFTDTFNIGDTFLLIGNASTYTISTITNYYTMTVSLLSGVGGTVSSASSYIIINNGQRFNVYGNGNITFGSQSSMWYDARYNALNIGSSVSQSLYKLNVNGNSQFQSTAGSSNTITVVMSQALTKGIYLTASSNYSNSYGIYDAMSVTPFLYSSKNASNGVSAPYCNYLSNSGSDTTLSVINNSGATAYPGSISIESRSYAGYAGYFGNTTGFLATIKDVIVIGNVYNGVQNGGGGALLYQLNSSTNVARSTSRISSSWIDNTNTSETAALSFYNISSGVLSERMRLYGNNLLLGTSITNGEGILQTAGNIAPTTNSTYNLGSLSYLWKTLYTSTSYIIPTGLTAGIIINGSNTLGGSNYCDFLRVTNNAGGVTTGSKTFRLNNLGSLEVLNNAYSGVIFSVTDDGIGNFSGSLSINGSLTSNDRKSLPYNSAAGTLLAMDNLNTKLDTDGYLYLSPVSGSFTWYGPTVYTVYGAGISQWSQTGQAISAGTWYRVPIGNSLGQPGDMVVCNVATSTGNSYRVTAIKTSSSPFYVGLTIERLY